MVNEDLSEDVDMDGKSADVVTCFLVTPFGDDSATSGEEARIFKEVEALRKHVFKPVETAFATGEEPLTLRIWDARRFNDLDQDTIRDKVIELIDTSDLVIVVMTARDKPNAFIEYGWATGMWKKPIVLKRKGFDLPANISNTLALEYDPDRLEPKDPAELSDIAKKLKRRISDELKENTRRSPFNHFPPTILAHGAVDLLGRFQNVSIEEWSRTLLEAETEIILASRALKEIIGQPFVDADGDETQIQQLLERKAMEGVKVTVIMQHVDNVSSGHLRLKSEDKSEATIREEQETAAKKWFTTKRSFERSRRAGRLDLPEDGFRVIQMHDRFLPFRATLTDKKLYLTLRFYTQKFNSGLCIVAEPGKKKTDPFNPSVYAQIREELEFLITENLERSEENYQQWLQEAG